MPSNTNEITLPSFLRGLDAIGDVNITLTLNSQPSCSYQLVSDTTFSSTYTNNNTAYNIYSAKYRVQNATETIDVTTGKHLLNVSLEGYYRPLLEREVVVDAGSYNLTTVASRAGVPIANGGQTKEAIEPFITTLGSEISQYANDQGLSIVYDTSIRFVRDGVGAAVIIPNDDVLDININHKDEHIYQFKFLPQYIEFEREESVGDETDAESQRPVFEVVSRPTRVVVNDPDNAETHPSTGNVRTLDMNFDMSGEKKIREVTTYEGEKIIKKKVTTYGYAYTSDVAAEMIDDLPAFTGQLSSYWRVVEDYTIDYLYDENYYIGYDKTGYKLDRFERETDGFELLEASGNSDADLQLEAAQYRFRRVPIVEYERLDLEAYYNYYSDATPSFDEMYIAYEQYNPTTRRTETRYERNREFVVPMFIKRKVMYSRCFDWITVPQGLAEYNGQVKTCGEERKELYNIEIRPSVNTRGLTVGTDRVEDTHDEYNEIMSSQDAQFQNHITQVESSSVQGRPGSVDSFQTYKRVERNSANRTTPLSEDKWIVHNGANSNLQPTGTITIPNVNSVREAVRVLERQLRQQRRFDNGEFTVTTFFNPNAKPNQKVMVAHNGRSFIGTVRSVNHNIKILGANKATGLTTITASTITQQNINLTLQRENSNNNARPNLFIPIPFNKYHVSEARDAIQNLPNRGSF